MIKATKFRIALIEDQYTWRAISELAQLLPLHCVDLFVRTSVATAWPFLQASAASLDLCIVDVKLRATPEHEFHYCIEHHPTDARTCGSHPLPKMFDLTHPFAVIGRTVRPYDTLDDGGWWLWAELYRRRVELGLRPVPTAIYSADEGVRAVSQPMKHAGVYSVLGKALGVPPAIIETGSPLVESLKNVTTISAVRLDPIGGEIDVTHRFTNLDGVTADSIADVIREQFGDQSRPDSWTASVKGNILVIAEPKSATDGKDEEALYHLLDEVSRRHLSEASFLKLADITTRIESDGANVMNEDLGGGWTFCTLFPHWTKRLVPSESQLNLRTFRQRFLSAEFGRAVALQFQSGGIKAVTHAGIQYKAAAGEVTYNHAGHNANCDCWKAATQQCTNLAQICPEQETEANKTLTNPISCTLADLRTKWQAKPCAELSPPINAALSTPCGNHVQYFVPSERFCESLTDVINNLRKHTAGEPINGQVDIKYKSWREGNNHRLALAFVAKATNGKGRPYKDRGEIINNNKRRLEWLKHWCDVWVVTKKSDNTELWVNAFGAVEESDSKPADLNNGFLGQFTTAHIFVLWGARETSTSECQHCNGG